MHKITWTYLEITSAIEQHLTHVVECSRGLKPDMAEATLGWHAQGIVNGWLAITDGAFVEDDKERLTRLARSIGEQVDSA